MVFDHHLHSPVIYQNYWKDKKNVSFNLVHVLGMIFCQSDGGSWFPLFPVVSFCLIFDFFFKFCGFFFSFLISLSVQTAVGSSPSRSSIIGTWVALYFKIGGMKAVLPVKQGSACLASPPLKNSPEVLNNSHKSSQMEGSYQGFQN